jgi:excinuclease ABC subunit A
MAVDIPQAADLRVVRINRRWGEVTVLLVGRVRFRWTRPLPVTAEASQGRITGARLLKDPLGWHICFRIQEPTVAVTRREDPAVGIDLGVVHTMALSDGRNLDMPSLLSKGEARRLQAHQRKAARRGRTQRAGALPSNREREAHRQVATLRGRQTRRRADWIHKTTTQIARSYGTIVVEELNIGGMTRSARGTAACPGKNVKAKAGLNRAVLGMAWGRALLFLTYKAEAQGGQLVRVAAAYSSQTCADCGQVGSENRRSRDLFRCATCGYETSADTNAAKVLLGRGLAALSGSAPGYGVAGRGAFAVRQAGKRQPGAGAVDALSVTMGCQNVGADRASPRTEEGNLSVTDRLVIRGAREHNLKNVHLDLPRNALIVFTGLSGSGKSSLAFDTIYAEGQRRYVESLSAYARQFLGLMEKPDVDFIEGLSPAISIDQKSTSKNPRSTVGTITEVYDYLRLLYARIGQPHCPVCGRPISRQTPDQIVDQILELPAGTRFQLLAPVVRGRKGEYEALLRSFSAKGFARARVDGEVRDLSEPIRLAKTYKHDIEIVVDRLVARGPEADEKARRRLADSVETAVGLSEGLVVVELGSDGDELKFSTHLACLYDNLSFEEPAPRNFSFNAPYGACPDCTGLGVKQEVDPELVVPNPSLPVTGGAIQPWQGTRGSSEYFDRLLVAVAEAEGFEPDAPWEELTPTQQHVVLYGADEQVHVRYKNRYGRTRAYHTTFEGVVTYLNRRYAEAESDSVRERVESYMREVPCPTCKGARLRPESLAVTIAGRNIAEVAAMSVGDAAEFFTGLELSDRDAFIAARVLKEINARLGFLLDVGLDYLSIDRASATLAGGEAQRIRLATQIGSGLTGVLYVLDEPSIGLHQRDNHRLIETLVRLRDLGNTLIVVEHDEATIRTADYLVDIGPGAGEHGGQIVAEGGLADLERTEASLTGQYMGGKRSIAVPARRRRPGERWLELAGVREHNLKDLSVRIPLGVFTCVTGVSGSGKSTLVNDVLLKALMQAVYRSRTSPGRYRSLAGAEHLDKVIDVDQSPIGRTPRSNPATYTGVFDHIRRLFAATNEAKVRGYQPGRFSFNVRGGRCEACAGDGTIKIDMQFLPDIYVPCEVCKGKRYNRETLEVHYKGHTIADVLDMSVEESLGLFRNIPPIARHLETLNDVGLGYIKLGQPAPTLSGGEAQRVKLASELAKRATGRTLYVLDEPTTGLHFDDVNKLLGVLHRLVDAGNSVIVIEHNLDVVKTADWVIDLGPEGGHRGGQVVAQGPPERVARTEGSYTGQFLASSLGLEPAGAVRA